MNNELPRDATSASHSHASLKFTSCSRLFPFKVCFIDSTFAIAFQSLLPFPTASIIPQRDDCVGIAIKFFIFYFGKKRKIEFSMAFVFPSEY